MHSSISSSDLTKGRLRTALQTAIAGVLLFGGVIVAFQFLVNTLRGGDDRVTTQIGVLPELVSQYPEKKKVMVFGSSMVQAGFEPLVFDEAMAQRGIDSVSYNYGMGGLNPEFQEIFTRRIQEAFQAADRKLDLALVEFNPFQATKVRKAATVFIADQNVAALSSNKELLDITLRDPTRGVRLFNIRYFRAGISAELITTALTRGVNQQAPKRSDAYRAADRRSSELATQFREAVRSDLPEYKQAPWQRSFRGGRGDKTRLSAETLETLKELMASRRHPELLQVDLQRRIDGADIIDLGFDQALVDAFIRMVKNFQAISARVEVLLLPRNTDWVHYAPETRARLDMVLKEIAKQANVVIKDYQTHPKISPEHFIDTTHLSLYDGIDIFTKILAEDYAEVLRD